MKKYFVILASVLIQMILGSIYAWSTISAALQSQIGLTKLQGQSIYGTLIMVFSLSLIIGGKMFRAYGPRLTASASGLVYALSFWGASMVSSFPGYLLFIGLGGGIATGLGYACPLSAGVAWFPKNKGLITGVAVFGFGAGSIVTNSIFASFLSTGTSVQTVFLALGLLGGGLIFLAAQIMGLPQEAPSAVKPSQRAWKIVDLVRTPTFWKMVIGLGTGSFAGLVVIGQAAGMTLDMGYGDTVGSTLPVLAVTLISLGNASGRLAWGWMNDRIPQFTISLNLGGSGLASLLLLVFGSVLSLYFVLVFLVGFFFGGSVVLFAAQTENSFGAGSLAGVYPFVFVFYGLAALIGPSVAGALLDTTGVYTGLLLLSGSVPLIGLISIGLLSQTEIKSQAA